MPQETSLDKYKIPAFQRKKSLGAKARRAKKPVTAFERRLAGIPVIKPKRKVVRRTTRVARSIVSRPISSSAETSYENPFGQGSYGNEYSPGFSNPLIEETPYESQSYETPSYSSSSSDPSLPDFREMRLCGKCEGYIEKIEVALVKLSASVRVEDRLIFESEDGGLFEQILGEMQIDREDTLTAYSGDDVGMKVKAAPAKNGNVYKVV